MMTQIKRWLLGIATVALHWSVRMIFCLQSYLLDLAPKLEYRLTRKALFCLLYDVILPIKLSISGALAWVLAARGRVR
jgi:hypothetical protein